MLKDVKKRLQKLSPMRKKSGVTNEEPYDSSEEQSSKKKSSSRRICIKVHFTLFPLFIDTMKVFFSDCIFAERGSELDLGYYSSDQSSGDNDEGEEEEWDGIQDEHTSTPSATPAPDTVTGILKTGKRVVQTYDAAFTVDNNDEEDEGTATTIVEIENFDVDREATEPKPRMKEFQSDEEILHKSLLRAALYAERVKKINNGIPVPPKQRQKKKKFRYLTSQERKANVTKERMKNRKVSK